MIACRVQADCLIFGFLLPAGARTAGSYFAAGRGIAVLPAKFMLEIVP